MTIILNDKSLLENVLSIVYAEDSQGKSYFKVITTLEILPVYPNEIFKNRSI